jgi:hypothetical protein
MMACIVVGGGGDGSGTPGGKHVLPPDLTATFGAEVFRAQLTSIADGRITPVPDPDYSSSTGGAALP